MTARSTVIADTGPLLTFLCRREWTRILYYALAGEPFAVPATVEREVLRKARVDGRFSTVTNQWSKLRNAEKLRVLPDDVTVELDAVVTRIERMPLVQRLETNQDLGELMVISHAVILGELGEDVVVVIQEGNGTRLARMEASRLGRRAAQATDGVMPGSIEVWSVDHILRVATLQGCPEIPNQAAMKKIWKEMRKYDDALPAIKETSLLDPELWRPSMGHDNNPDG